MLDLTVGPDGADADSTQLLPIKIIPFDPARDREKVRGWIALLVVGCLMLIVLCALAALLYHPDSTATKEIIQTVLAPVVGLVGAVTGFYFGEKAR